MSLNLQSSQLSDFDLCPRMWYYGYHLWRGVPANAAMKRGSAFHAACELHWKDNIAIPDLPEAIVNAGDEKDEDWQPYLAEVMSAFVYYKPIYESSDWQFATINGEIAIELEVKMEIAPGIYVWMKFDSIRENKNNGKLAIFDWKVTSMALTDWFSAKFEMSNQTLLYTFAGKELFDSDLHGFYIDGVQIKNGKYNNQTFYFPLARQLDEFLAETARKAEWIKTHLDDEEYFEHRYTNCINKYNKKCPYFMVCHSRPERRAELLANDIFVDKKPIYAFT